MSAFCRPVHAVVPVKAPGPGKSRLMGVVPDRVRADLVISMLDAVLGACRSARRVQGVTVIARDVAAVRRVVPDWADVVPEPAGVETLDAALGQTLDGLGLDGEGRAGVAVVMADLPLLDGPSLDRALARMSGPDSALVVPDQHGTGTSLLAWRNGRFRDFRYGPHSFQAHLSALRAAGFAPVAHPGGAGFHDIDTFEDIESVRALVRAGRRRSAALRELAA